ncbi:MAG: hypothetical protein KAH21_10455 [Spirochaetaceae bacterium]|nr:hypothetical protein [Spirochaetaceae bacterium]
MSKKAVLLFVLALTVFILFVSCAPGSGSYSPADRAGFLSGIWHGWLAPFTLIIGLFNRSIRVYEVFNTGWWYDFGFYIAVISGFGSLSLARGRKHRKRQDED